MAGLVLDTCCWLVWLIASDATWLELARILAILTLGFLAFLWQLKKMEIRFCGMNMRSKTKRKAVKAHPATVRE